MEELYGKVRSGPWLFKALSIHLSLYFYLHTDKESRFSFLNLVPRTSSNDPKAYSLALFSTIFLLALIESNNSSARTARIDRRVSLI